MKKSTIILACIVAILLVGSVGTYMTKDRKAPVITVPAANLVYTEGDSTSGLLTGVKATDDRDGDLSAQVRIYNVVRMENARQAQVTYAVYDSNYNLGKATKVVAYEEKKADSKNDTTEEAAESENTTTTGASGKTETSKQKETDKTDDKLTGEGYDDPPLISHGSPVIRLKTHEVEIPKGGYFYSMDYMDTAVDDVDNLDYLYDHLYLEGDKYDVDEPGQYELQYYCVDSSGNISNIAKLMLTVSDKAEKEKD